MLWDLDVKNWPERACEIAGRNLTQEEWNRYIGDGSYHVSCLIAKLREIDAHYDEPGAAKEFGQLVALAAEGKEADLNNSICWTGGLDGFAGVVQPACERAVKLNPAGGGYWDSLALVLARQGPAHYAEAIKGFERFIEYAKGNDLLKARSAERQSWIAALKAGTNPFDDPVLLRALRRQ